MAIVCFLLAAAAVTVEAGRAHGPRQAPGYVSTVLEIRPAVPGLTARVIDGDTLISVRNWSNRTIVLLDAAGRSLFRFDAQGVARYTGSGWRRMKRGTSHTWHDPRIHWGAAEPPAAVARAPEQPHSIASWQIRGTVDGRPIAIHGSLGWVPATPTTASPRTQGSTLGGWVVGAIVLAGVVAASALTVLVARRR